MPRTCHGLVVRKDTAETNLKVITSGNRIAENGYEALTAGRHVQPTECNHIGKASGGLRGWKSLSRTERPEVATGRLREVQL